MELSDILILSVVFLLAAVALWWLYYTRTKKLLRKLGDDHEHRSRQYFARMEDRMSRPIHEWRPVANGEAWAVVFTYNRCGFLEQSVRSLRTAEPSLRIAVVDNGSTDGAQELLLRLFHEGVVDKILLNRHADVPQWQKAYNMHQVFRLLAMEECEYLVWMDDDVLVRQPFLAPARRILGELAGRGVALVSMLTDEEQNTHHPTEEECDIGGVRVRVKRSFNGAFVLVPVALLRDFGLPPIREGCDELASEDWYYSRMLQTRGLRVAATEFADHLGAGDSLRKKMFS